LKNIQIEIPLDWNLSKNKKFIGKTKKVLNPAYRAIKEAIGWEIYNKLQELEGQFEKKKVWVTIMVYKTLRGDCHNLIEGILDAIKTQIQVDDNYYSVHCDYEISKDKKITIEVSQGD
jgi:Holliday junction resolvase RusA-like endonuclease